MVHLHHGYIWCGILLLSYLKYYEMGLVNSMLNNFLYPCTKRFVLLFLSLHKLYFVVMCCDYPCTNCRLSWYFPLYVFSLSVHKLLAVVMCCLPIHAQTVWYFAVLFLYPYTNCMLVCRVVFALSMHKPYVLSLYCFVCETNCDLSLSFCFSFSFRRIISWCEVFNWL